MTLHDKPKKPLKALKSIRVRKNISTATMGELLSMDRSTYCYKEAGKGRFTIEEAAILMGYFNMTFEQLFGGIY